MPTAGGSSSSSGNGAPVRKGPWMAEEDEILMEYVRKHGPRDWSSIRSKGLLPRTGKSCRLRWVNKLKPDLKTGCKFTAEEERIVIDLQARFGNKWARIATYLPGRTDNDVKNFWSTRQKRLARLLQHPLPRSASSSSHKNNSSSNNNNIGNAPMYSTMPQMRIHPDTNMNNNIHSYCKGNQCIPGGSLKAEKMPENLNMVSNIEVMPTFPFPGHPANVLPAAMQQPWPLSQIALQPNLELPLFQECSEISNSLDELGLFQEDFPREEEQSQCMNFYEDFPYFSVPTGEQHFEMKPDQINTTATMPDNFFDEFPVDMFDNVPEPPPLLPPDTSTSQGWS